MPDIDPQKNIETLNRGIVFFSAHVYFTLKRVGFNFSLSKVRLRVELNNELR